MPFKINYMVSTSAVFFLRYYPFSQMYSNFTTEKMGRGGGMKFEISITFTGYTPR
jgi:hypothetical protein